MGELAESYTLPHRSALSSVELIKQVKVLDAPRAILGYTALLLTLASLDIETLHLFSRGGLVIHVRVEGDISEHVQFKVVRIRACFSRKMGNTAASGATW